jgi:hypothetical protein
MHYHFEGVLTARDSKRHIPHPFAVPTGSGELDVHFRFAPSRVHAIDNLITLTLFDPAGFRGAGHRGGGSHRVHIDPAQATPGYFPGPLPFGSWTVEIGTHMVMPGEPVQYQLDVIVAEGAATTTEAPRSVTAPPPGGPRRGPGWYRGDLHTHTHHSDADGLTVQGLIQSARDHGLDFVFLTDHNTTAGLEEMDAACSDDLLTAGGIELSSFWGHALCLGTRRWVDWRVRPGTGDMDRTATAAYADGQLFIIAHPEAVGDPFCTGCTWRYGGMMPGSARLVEVWNGPWGCNSNNEDALSLWYDWLNQGLALVATAGTDVHRARDYAAHPGLNVVYADALSEAALLSALLSGHVYLSAGPRVTFQARTEGGERRIMGDTVAQPATFDTTWMGCPADAQIRLIANGALLDQWTTGVHGERQWSMAPEEAHWVLVEIRDGDGGMLAITNPIHLAQGATAG